jgi:short-subunit dehydrogenase
VRRLDGARVVVTGAAGGIGSRLAAQLREAGAHVTGVDRIACPACDASLIVDLGDEDSLARLGETLAARQVDILVNVAGVQYFGPLERQAPESLRLAYAVNLIAPAILIRAVLPQMRTRRSGQVVNIGSVLGAISYPHFAAYSSSKAGLRGLSEALRREVAGLGIHVTHVAPRAVRTALNTDAINRFFALAGMRTDDPDRVAVQIARAILDRRKDVAIGGRERFLIRVNALLPRLVDLGLSAETAKARKLFPS